MGAPPKPWPPATRALEARSATDPARLSADRDAAARADRIIGALPDGAIVVTGQERHDTESAVMVAFDLTGTADGTAWNDVIRVQQPAPSWWRSVRGWYATLAPSAPSS